MPGDLRIRGGLVIPAREITWRFSRASGPGGQGVNTTDSRAELVFDLGATSALPAHLKQRALDRLAGRLVGGTLTIVAAAERSQLQNRRVAEERLRELLAASAHAAHACLRRAASRRQAASRRGEAAASGRRALIRCLPGA